MKIESSNITFLSQRAFLQETTRKETLRAWVGAQRPDFEGRGQPAALVRERQAEAVRNAAAAQAKISAEAQPAKKTAPTDDEYDPEKDPKLRLIILIIEKLTGKKVHLLSAKDLKGCGQTPDVPDAKQADQAPAQQRQGWGVEYDYHESNHEAEVTSFTATGVIKTADGKEINFTTQLTMSREFVSEQDVSLRLGDAQMKDPLVINFEGTAAQLTDTKFAFDLDTDGRQDQISFVGPGSGFLALDNNGDGVVSNGSELFGTQTGDGFAELAAYDQDHNNWIDENDSIFSRLRLWTKDAQGNDSLVSLSQKGIGAIYLGNVSTQFDLNNSQNEQLGQVKSSGVYLKEDGSVGTAQQVDLVV